MFPAGEGRYMNDDGTEFNPNLIPTPSLCTTCRSYNDTDPEAEVLCNLTRADGQDDGVFICYGYAPTSPNINRKAVLRGLCEQAGIPFLDDNLGPEDGLGLDLDLE